MTVTVITTYSLQTGDSNCHAKGSLAKFELNYHCLYCFYRSFRIRTHLDSANITLEVFPTAKIPFLFHY